MFEPTFTTQHGVLFEEDALNILPSLQSGVMDCIFADPPFNLGKNYRNGFQDNLDTSSYFTWCAEWLQEGARVLKPGGAFFVYATPELAIRFAEILRTTLNFRHWIAVTVNNPPLKLSRVLKWGLAKKLWLTSLSTLVLRWNRHDTWGCVS